MAALACIDALSALYQGVIKKGEPMARHTSLKVGGPCDLYLEPATLEDLRIAVAFLTQQGMTLTTVGDGSNLLVNDGGVDGAVISLSGMETSVEEECHGDAVHLTVPAGMKTQKLCRFAATKGYAGLNFLAGIPGTVGGALAMNAGTTPIAFESVLESLTIVEISGKIRTVKRDALCLDYRQLSIEAKGRMDADFPIITSARFHLSRGDKTTLMDERTGLLAKRKASQPVNLPSAGCFFKNPPGGPPAGKLIDDLGLKGETQGGAKISELHANYLVNTGGATASDILTLARRIKNRVRQNHGIELEEEVTLVGR